MDLLVHPLRCLPAPSSLPPGAGNEPDEPEHEEAKHREEGFGSRGLAVAHGHAPAVSRHHDGHELALLGVADHAPGFLHVEVRAVYPLRPEPVH